MADQTSHVTVPRRITPEMADALESNFAATSTASAIHAANWQEAWEKCLSAAPASEGGAGERACDWCDGRRTTQTPSTDFTIICPYCKGTGKEATRSEDKPGGALDDAMQRLRVLRDQARNGTAVTDPDEYEADELDAILSVIEPALATREVAPAGSAHPCYDEHQPGCDCVIPPQSSAPTPSYLERLSAPADHVSDVRQMVEASGEAEEPSLVDWFGQFIERHDTDTLIACLDRVRDSYRAQPQARSGEGQ